LNAQIEQALAQVGKARGDMPRSVAVAPDPAVAERIVRQAA